MWKGFTTFSQLARVKLSHARRFNMQRDLTSPMQTSRTFSAIRSLRTSQPQDDQDHFHDRSKLDPQRTENSQSATTDEVATRQSAFDPSRTSPEREMGASKAESKQTGDRRDPLDVSAANKDVSGARDPIEGGAAKNVGTGRHSGRGRTPKNRERK